MSERILPSLCRQLNFSKPCHLAVGSRSEGSFSVSLLDLCIDLFIAEDTDIYFGPDLRQMQPELIGAFQDWEQCNWKFLFQLPDIFAQDMLQAKEFITESFTKFYQLPRHERPNLIFLIDAVEDMLREAGLSEDEMGKFTLLHYWA